MQHYRELEVWKRSHALVLRIYALTKTFPADERFGLTSQLRRAAISVAANIVLSADQVLVIGSQAIHGSIDTTIPEAERSIEVDVAALDDPDGSLADLVDGSIGELSVFQETYGYYAQRVTPQTAVLPAGWRKRLVRFRTPATNGVTALCLEPHDLWISKAIGQDECASDYALDQETAQRIKRLAQRWGVSQAEVIRRSVEQAATNAAGGALTPADAVAHYVDHPPANLYLDDIDYDFRVFDSPGELHRQIVELNRINNRSRVVAGYCWDWKGKRDPDVKDVRIEAFNYAARWNLDSSRP